MDWTRIGSFFHQRRLAAPTFLALACVLVWGRIVTFGFVWDDRAYILQNEALRSPHRILDLLTKASAQQATSPPSFFGVFRPLRTLVFALMTWPFGQPQPWLFHAASLAVHALATVLLYFLLTRLLGIIEVEEARDSRERGDAHSPAHDSCGRAGANLAAFLGALAFCVNPVNAEVVSWAKCLDDLLATTLLLGAVLLAWEAWKPGSLSEKRLAASAGATETGSVGGRGAPRPGLAIASVVCFGAALLCKESVVACFPLLLFPLLLWPAPRGRGVKWFAVLALVAIGFVLWRQHALGSNAQVTVPLSGTWGQTLVDMLPVVLLYLRTMLGAPPFLPDYSFMQGGSRFFSPVDLLGLGLLLVAVGVGVVALLRARRQVWLWLGLAWVLLALVPVSNLVPMMQYFAERFTYLPLAGFTLVVTGALYQVSRAMRHQPRVRSLIMASAVVAVLGTWGAEAVAGTARWRSEATLFRYTYHNAPPSGRIVGNYLMVLDRASDPGGMRAALDAHPELTKGNLWLRWMEAMVLARESRVAEAAAQMRELEPKFPGDADFLLDAGKVFAQAGDLPRARATFAAAAKALPVSAAAWSNLGLLYGQGHEPERARQCFARVTQLAPTSVEAWNNLGLSLNELRRFPEAEQSFRTGLRLAPNDLNCWRGLSYAGWQQKEWPTVREALAKVAQFQPAPLQHSQAAAR